MHHLKLENHLNNRQIPTQSYRSNLGEFLDPVSLALLLRHVVRVVHPPAVRSREDADIHARYPGKSSTDGTAAVPVIVNSFRSKDQGA